MRDLGLVLTTAAVAPGWLRGLVGLGGFGLGAVGCAALAVVEWGAWALVLPGRRPGALAAEAASTGAPIEAVAPDGVRLVGSWYPAAQGAARGRTVVLI